MERMLKKNGEVGNPRRISQAKFTSKSRENEFANDIDNSPKMLAQRMKLQSLFGGAIQRQGGEEELLQGKFGSVQREDPPNNTGMPDHLKSGIESLSGMSMDKVKVHYNSSQPAQLNAHAYTQGTDIHVAPGQEKHLPHEAWHVVQQAQGRVQPTMQMKGGVSINDDEGLENEADVMGARAAGIMQAFRRDSRPASINFSPPNKVVPVQRQILGESGFIRNQKLAELHSNSDYSLGFTPPTVNFTQITQPQDVVDAFKGKDDLISVEESTPGNFSASVKTVPTNHMGYMMYLPEPGPWKMKAIKKDILSAFGVHDNGRNLTNDIDIEITGPKGHEVLAKQVESHEMVHAKDNERVRDEIFKPWDRSLSMLKNANTVFQGGSAEIASNKLWAQVGGSLAKKAADADAEWGKCSKVFHDSKKGKTVVDNDNTRINPEQTKAVFCYYLTI
jgi:hypothetical protein